MSGLNIARAEATPAGPPPAWMALEQTYPLYMAFTLLGTLALLALIHSARMAFALTSAPAPVDVERGAVRKGPGAVSWRRLPAAAAAAFRVVAFRLALPLGFGRTLIGSEAFVIAAYMAALWTWTFINTDRFTLKEYNQRAAVMAVAQFPFVIGLAGKNNVVSFLTGISHQKLNVFHRAAGRAVLILLWIHFIGNYVAGLYPGSFTHIWIICGVISLGAITANAIVTLPPVRRYVYEFFLVTHILLNITFLIAGYYHVAHFATTRWHNYYYLPGFFLWGLDRTVRACRTFWANTLWRRDPACAQGTLERVSADTVRITLTRAVSWTAGQHAYLALPSIGGLPTEAHPFTIAAAPTPLDGSPGPAARELSFVVRARSGATRRMLALAEREPCSVPVLLDGPYGAPPDLAGFSTVVLVAGGSGVSYTLAMLLNLVSLANQKLASTRRIVFVWAVRDPEHVQWIAQTLQAALAAAPLKLAITLHIHATRARGPTTVVDLPDDASTVGLCDDIAKEKYAFAPHVGALAVAPGRPDVDAIIAGELERAGGPVSVDVCGPAALVGAVRRATCVSPLAVLRGQAPVTLHVEKFGM